MPSPVRGRFWMFTLNNPQPEEDPRAWPSIKGKPISFRWNSYKDYPEEDWEFPVPEGFEQEPSPPSPRTVSDIVFNEYRDNQDGEPVLRPSYPVNPAAPKGASRYTRAYRDK